MPLKERPLHLRHRKIPVRGILSEKRLVPKEAADPAAKDDAAPVANGAAKGHPGGRDRVGVAAVLDLRKPPFSKTSRLGVYVRYGHADKN